MNTLTHLVGPSFFEALETHENLKRTQHPQQNKRNHKKTNPFLPQTNPQRTHNKP